MEYKHVQFDESVNVTRTRPLVELSKYIVSILLIVLIAYGLARGAIELLVPYIDPKTERDIWNTIYRHDFTTAKKDIPTQQKLQSLLNRIPKTGLPDYEYEIIYEDSARVNAYALPAGKIVIYKGLLKAMPSENALVFVLGHELGHFANRDHLRGMGVNLLSSLLLLPVLGSDAGKIASMISGTLSMNFSRSQERAADRSGMQALQAVYGHVGGATEFFEYTIKKEDTLTRLLNYNSTHPASSERIEAAKAYMTKHGMKTGATRPKSW